MNIKKLARDEKGQALVVVLILLVISGLIIAPLLSYLGTGVITGNVYVSRTDELYAADAGVEDAVWKIQNGAVDLTKCYDEFPYPMGDVNDRLVDVIITLTRFEDDIPWDYLILSTATDADGSATEVQAYVTGTSVCSDYSGILNQIITSQGEIDLNKVTLNCSEEHEPNDHYKGAWPETQQEITQFCQWYLLNVSDVEPYDSDIVDLAGDSRQLERLRRVGPLELLNSVNHPATLALNGTLYITGDTLIGAQGHDFTLDLNRQTIFVESSSAGPDKALWIGGKCTIKGPGIIIALGDIYFEPNPDVGGESEPVFVMSVAGTTTIRPGVSMYGAVAGSIEVAVQQGNNPIINYPEGGFGDLNFAGLLPPKLVYRVDSWEVSRASRQED